MHLAQVGYADSVVGEMIAQLEQAGLYDDTMIVVMADHGIAVRPNIEHRRVVTEETVGDIAAIPLFIKRPDHEDGGVDDYRAETVDVLPTIAAVLGVDVPWEMEGVSLFADNRPERLESRVTGSNGTIVFGTDGSEARTIAARKIDHFGTHGPFGLAPPGYEDLLGRRVAEFDVRSDSDVIATVRDLSAFGAVDLDGPSLPVWISGFIRRDDADGNDLVLAVVVNGRVAAITRSSQTDDEATTYGAMFAPDALIDGANGVDLVLIQGVGTDREFQRIGP